jgi:two-component system chemotaxis response regulator CheB
VDRVPTRDIIVIGGSAGALQPLQDGTLSHFRCHEGHAYTGKVLAAHQGEELEAALWSAVRVLDKHAALLRRLHHTIGGESFSERAADTEQKAKLIRSTLLGTSEGEAS